MATRSDLCQHAWYPVGVSQDLIASSPLTRCLETAALAFPDQFVASSDGAPRTAAVVVVSTLLPEIVHSWADTGRPLDVVCDSHPQLERFRGTESRSRFQHVGCQPNQPVRPCRCVGRPSASPASPAPRRHACTPAQPRDVYDDTAVVRQRSRAPSSIV